MKVTIASTRTCNACKVISQTSSYLIYFKDVGVLSSFRLKIMAFPVDAMRDFDPLLGIFLQLSVYCIHRKNFSVCQLLKTLLKFIYDSLRPLFNLGKYPPQDSNRDNDHTQQTFDVSWTSDRRQTPTS